MRGGLWLGFFKGGAKYFKDGEVRRSYTHLDGLGDGRVNSLWLDRQGVVWASTVGGLSRIEDGHVITLGRKNGLPCDSLDWSIQDNLGSLWLNMACGLVRIAREELDSWVANPTVKVGTTIFDSSDGVKSHAFYISTTPHVGKSSDGKIWFTNLDGVSIVDPAHLPTNKLLPPVHIEQIVADRKIYSESIKGPAVASLRLTARVHDLDIYYVGLSFVAPEKMQFRVKLEGQDQDWLTPVDPRHMHYTNLAPGNYRFRVIASNNSGVWNEEGAALDFVIPPAWYQTYWFPAACVAAFLALLWALYQYRLHQLAQQFNMRLKERVGERTRIARDLHDTLLQSFHGILLFLQSGIHLLDEHPAEAKKL